MPTYGSRLAQPKFHPHRHRLQQRWHLRNPQHRVREPIRMPTCGGRLIQPKFHPHRGRHRPQMRYPQREHPLCLRMCEPGLPHDGFRSRRTGLQWAPLTCQTQADPQRQQMRQPDKWGKPHEIHNRYQRQVQYRCQISLGHPHRSEPTRCRLPQPVRNQSPRCHWLQRMQMIHLHRLLLSHFRDGHDLCPSG